MTTMQAEKPLDFLLLQAYQNWQDALRPALKKHDLTFPQYQVLSSVATLALSNIVVTQVMASQMALVDVMTTSQVIKNLEKKQLLFRTTSLEDSRAKAIYLTNKGQSLIQAAMIDVTQSNTAFFQNAGPSQHELAQLLKSLNRTSPQAS